MEKRAVPGRRATMHKSKIEDEIFKQFKEIQVGRTYFGKCGVGEERQTAKQEPDNVETSEAMLNIWN